VPSIERQKRVGGASRVVDRQMLDRRGRSQEIGLNEGKEEIRVAWARNHVRTEALSTLRLLPQRAGGTGVHALVEKQVVLT